MASFDWYQATLIKDLPPRVVVDTLAGEIVNAHSVEVGPGGQNYRHSAAILSADHDELARVYYGGNGNPHVRGTGANAPEVAGALRKHWPAGAAVTRVDSCLDMRGDFNEVAPRIRAFLDKNRLKGELKSPLGTSLGSTAYLGAAASPFRVRVYEKTLQLASKGHDVSGMPLDLLRFELQVRPIRDGRLAAATMSPEELWGGSPWVRSFAAQFIGIFADRVSMQTRLQTTYERRQSAIAQQWGRTLLEWVERAGGPSEFVQELSALMEAHRPTRH